MRTALRCARAYGDNMSPVTPLVVMALSGIALMSMTVVLVWSLRTTRSLSEIIQDARH